MPSKAAITKESAPQLPVGMWCVLCAWIVFAGADWLQFSAYGNRGTIPVIRKEKPTMAHRGGPSVVMFLHRHCPCSLASLRELQRIMSRADDKVRCTIYFYTPPNRSAEWAQGAHWELAQQIPRCELRIDPQGAIAAKRGAKNSGEIQAFDSHGVCRFHGGLTSSRGHEGVSVGYMAVLAVLSGNAANRSQWLR